MFVVVQAEKRRFELEWKRLEVLKRLAGKGRKFISGDRARAIMDELLAHSNAGAK